MNIRFTKKTEETRFMKDGFYQNGSYYYAINKGSLTKVFTQGENGDYASIITELTSDRTDQDLGEANEIGHEDFLEAYNSVLVKASFGISTPQPQQA